MSLEKNHQTAEGCSRTEQYAMLLADYIDGTLSASKSDEIRSHLSTCEPCGNLYRKILHSNALTGQVRDHKADFIGSMSVETKQRMMDQIRQSIRTMPNAVQEAQQERKKLLFFPVRRWAYASTAAGFAVLILVIALLIRMDPFGTMSKTTDFTGNASQTNAEIDNNYCYEDASNAYSGSHSNNDKGNDAETAVDASGQLVREVVTDEAFGPILAIPDDSEDLLAAMQGLSAYLEIQNETDSYRAVVAFPSGLIQSKADDIGSITDSLSQRGLPAKIEIISGENSQKLVEYTSKENVAYLQDAIADKAVDFLVITICR